MALLRRLSITDSAALVLSGIAVIAAWLVADRIYERVPHIEDEVAYVWEAKAMAGGSNDAVASRPGF